MDLERLERAVAAYREQLPPDDIKRLEFFQGVWEIQSRLSSRGLLEVPYQVPDSQSLKTWYWEEKPILMMAPLQPSSPVFLDALKELSSYLVERGGFASGVAAGLGSFDWEALIAQIDLGQAGYAPSDFLESCEEVAKRVLGVEGASETDDACADGANGTQGSDSNSNSNSNSNSDIASDNSADRVDDTSASTAFATLVALVTNVLALALRCVLESVAQQLTASAALVEESATHLKPTRCPVCGGHASLSSVGQVPSGAANGRMLYCGLCGTSWEFERIRCAHCGSRSQGDLHYFHLEGDEAHRLYLCKECDTYLRTVFLSQLGVPFSFEVEDVVMARLDHIAHDPRFTDRDDG